MYDKRQYQNVIDYCTNKAEADGVQCDPEYLLILGQAHLDRGEESAIDEAEKNWLKCTNDPIVAPIAYYYLGDLYFGLGDGFRDKSTGCFHRAKDLGLAEGSIGLGQIHLSKAFEFRDEGNHEKEMVEYLRAISELNNAFASPSLSSQLRSIALRKSVYFNMNDMESCVRDAEIEKTLSLYLEKGG